MNPQTSQEASLSRQTPLQASSSRSPGQISQAQSSKNTPNNSETFKKVGKWTPEEDELLKEYVSYTARNSGKRSASTFQVELRFNACTDGRKS